MNIISINVGALNTNCYLVTSEDATLIIDPGDESGKIIKIIEDKSLKPKLCLLTHAHFDHVLAVVDVIEKYKIPLLLNQKDTFLLKESIEFGRIEEFIEFIDEKTKISLGNVQFQVIETPGHTPGSLSFLCGDENVAFVGDLIFAGGFVGRTDFEYGNGAILSESMGKVLELPPNTTIYPGHGPYFYINEWKT